MGIGTAKAILISLTAISSSCDFLVCTFVFFKSMQWNACAFWMVLKSVIRLMQIDVEFQELFDHLFSKTDIDEYIDFDIEVVISLPAINRLIVECGQETRNKSIAEFIETSNATAEEANQSKEEPEIVR